MKRSIVVAFLHHALHGAGGLIAYFLYLAYTDFQGRRGELLIWAVLSVVVFIIFLAAFNRLTCSRARVLQMVDAIAPGEWTTVKDPTGGDGFVVGTRGRLAFWLRTSRPLLDFWPFYMPPVGPRGDVKPAGLQFLNVANKLRDGGILIWDRDAVDLRNASYQTAFEVAPLVEREFGSWMSCEGVNEILKDSFAAAEKVLDAGEKRGSESASSPVASGSEAEL